jgi:hypothetical protein
MNELLDSQESVPVKTEPAGIDLGMWLGRREAFGLIAGRCSAAEGEVMARIREQKLFLDYHCDWRSSAPGTCMRRAATGIAPSRPTSRNKV